MISVPTLTAMHFYNSETCEKKEFLKKFNKIKNYFIVRKKYDSGDENSTIAKSCDN